VSKGQFSGHYFAQLGHERLAAVMPGMPADETCVLLKLHVQAGISRQRFDLADGHVTRTGKKMKKDEVARWLVDLTPGLSVVRARKVILSLEKDYKQVTISKAGYVKLTSWAAEQRCPQTAGAAKTQRSRRKSDVERAREYLSSYKGTVFEVDTLMDLLVRGLNKKSRKFVEPVLKELTDAQDVVPADGGLQVCVSCVVAKPAAPSALPPPPVSEGAIAREGEGHMITPDGVTCDHSHSHIHKRDTNVSHEHDGRVRALPQKESPTSAITEPGPRLHDHFVDEKRGVEGAPKADIWAVHHRHLPETAARILGAPDFKKTCAILTAKLRALTNHCGPEHAQETFRMLVQEVSTELACSGGRLKFPERELCARLNEATGQPRRQQQPRGMHPARTGGR